MNSLLRGLARGAPFLIIAGLIGAVFLARLDPRVAAVEPPALHPRDHFVAIASPQPGLLWMVGLEGKIVSSGDGGATWQTRKAAGAPGLQDIAAWSATEAVVVGDAGTILRTDDGGRTWSPVPAPLESPVRLLHVSRDPAGRLWVVGEMNTLLVSDDGGRTFARRAERQDVGLNAVAFATPERGWLVGEFGTLRATKDGGATWSNRPPAEGSLMDTAACGSSGRGIAVGLQGRVLATSDAGRSWHALPTTTHEHLFSITCDNNAFIALGDRGAAVEGTFESGSPLPTLRRVVLPGAPPVWRTAAVRSDDRLLLGGALSGLVADGRYHGFGR